MPAEDNKNSNIRADDNSFAFGEIHVGGNVRDIHIGHTIGFTPSRSLRSSPKSELHPNRNPSMDAVHIKDWISLVFSLR